MGEACFPSLQNQIFAKVIYIKNCLLFSAAANICQEVLQLIDYFFWFAYLFVLEGLKLSRRAGNGGGGNSVLEARQVCTPSPLKRLLLHRRACPAASLQLPEGTQVFHGNRWKMDLTLPWKIAIEHARLPSLIILRQELMSNSTVIHHLPSCPSATSAWCFLH